MNSFSLEVHDVNQKLDWCVNLGRSVEIFLSFGAFLFMVSKSWDFNDSPLKNVGGFGEI